MNFLLLLITVLLIAFSTELVYAEPFYYPTIRGQNYDQIITDVDAEKNVHVKWVGYDYTRIMDGNGKWQDYITQNTDTRISYESTQFTAALDKSTCALKVYEIGGLEEKEKLVISHTVKTAPNGSNIWSLDNVNNIRCNSMLGNKQITATKDSSLIGIGTKFDVVYDFTSMGNFKWSYKLKNTDPLKLDQKYGFTTVFDGMIKIEMNGQVYDTSIIQEPIIISANDLDTSYIRMYDDSGFDVNFDTQNYIHNYLWVIKIQHGKVIFDFTYSKGRVGIGDTLEVDPRFSQTGTWGRVLTTSATGSACPGAPYSNSTLQNVPILADSGTSSVCGRGWWYYILTSIPDTATIIDVDFNVTGTALENGGKNCNLGKLANFPPSRTASEQWSDIGSMSNYLSNNAMCTSATFQTFDLGNQANTDVQSALSSNKFALGLKFNDETRSAGVDTRFTHTGGALTIQYVTQLPNPASSLSADSQARKVSYTWTQTAGTTITNYYIGRSLDNSTWPGANKTLVGNVTTYLDTAYYRPGLLYYANITANNGLNSTAKYTSFTMDNYATAPLNPYTTARGDTSIKLNWSPPSSDGNSAVTGYRIEYCVTCTSWTLLVNQTNTLNYNHTGIVGSPTVKYRMATWNGVGISAFTANFTGTTFKPTTGNITLIKGVVGDTVQINSTISITQASPSPVTVSQLKLYRNGTLIETKNVSVQIAQGASSSSFDPFWNRMLTGSTYSFKMYATVSNSTGTVQLASSNLTATRQYDPTYFNAQTDPATEGLVNYTLDRFSNEDGIYLRVNRYGGSLGGTWEIDCISQTNSEAAATRNQSLSWPGTWRNYSNVGYFNSTWTDFRNTHGYITCFNPPGILFSTTSYTNSSLALFGIQIFDDSYGAMLGVPVGIFFLAMAGSMANKRTAPTWIIVVLAMAGTMAAIGFFTLNPLVWGLALVTGLLGVLVNQKVF